MITFPARAGSTPKIHGVTGSNLLNSLCSVAFVPHGTCEIPGAHRSLFAEQPRVADKKICPICNKWRAERYCPAKGEKICAIDCGTEREVTIDCPSDCTYLVAAHRWEQNHPKPLDEGDIPF